MPCFHRATILSLSLSMRLLTKILNKRRRRPAKTDRLLRLKQGGSTASRLELSSEAMRARLKLPGRTDFRRHGCFSRFNSGQENRWLFVVVQ